MAQPVKIKPWLSVEKMFQWLQNAPDDKAHKRRMAIWLTHTGRLDAVKVAQILDISTPALWLWIRQYNSEGPKGLDRTGRGGRRWAFMTESQEAEFLAPFIRLIQNGKEIKPAQIKKAVEKKLRRKVSAAYIYRLLARHQWDDIIAQSKLAAKAPPRDDDFQKLSRPWQRVSQ